MTAIQPDVAPAEDRDDTDALPVLDRAAIRNAEDIRVEPVKVPEWGGIVYVRTLTGSERDDWEDASIQGRGKDRRVSLRNLRARLVALAACNAEGQRIFTDADASWLGEEKSSAALDRLFTKAQHLSKITEEDIEELVGN
jgi:hypothetical protein